MKHNPLRLQLDTYPYRIDMPLRFSDIDPQWHLNNVRVGEYYQECRVSFFRHLHDNFGYQRPRGSRTLVAHQAFDYLDEVTYPGTATVGIGVSRVGTRSWSFSMGLFKADRCAGLSTAVIVYADERGPTDLPDDYRALLERFALPAASLS